MLTYECPKCHKTCLVHESNAGGGWACYGKDGAPHEAVRMVPEDEILSDAQTVSMKPAADPREPPRALRWRG